MAGIKTSQLDFAAQPATGSTVEYQLAVPGGGYVSKRILISDLRGAVAAAFATLSGQPADNAALRAVIESFQDQINALATGAGIGFSTAATTANRLSQTLARPTITVVGADAWLYVGGTVSTPASWINLSASPFPAFPVSPAGKVLKIAADGITLIWGTDEAGTPAEISGKVDIAGGIIDLTQYTPATPAFWAGLTNGGGKVEAKVAFDFLQARISAIPALATDAEYLANNTTKAATPDQVNRLGETRITFTPTTPIDADGLVLTGGKAVIRVFADWVVGRLKDLTTAVAAKFTLPANGNPGQYINGAGALAAFPDFSASALTETVTQPGHGFVVGRVLRNLGGLWGLANANSPSAARSIGIVSQVIDANTFVLTTSGKMNTGTMGLASSTLYYLSATPGVLTATLPTGGLVVRPVLITTDANTGFVFSDAPGTVPGGVIDGDKGDIIVSASGATWTIDQKSATTGQVLQWDGTQWIPGTVSGGGGGAGVTDGDKGDIVVSGTGSAWTVKASAVRGTVLAGLDNNLPGTVTAADNLLQAAGKLQRQATANANLANSFNLNVDFAGLATSSGFVFNQKFTITALPSTARIATITYKVGAAAARTAIADANTDIAATVGIFELVITVTFSAGQNAGVVSIPCLYV